MKHVCAILLLVAVVIAACGQLSTDASASSFISTDAPNANPDIYNLPESILQSDTAQLVDAILEYPRLHHFIISNLDTLDTYTKMRAQFNGFAELESRSDAGSVMLAQYLSLTDNLATDKSESQQEDILEHLYLELLLSLPVYADKLTDIEYSSFSEVTQSLLAEAGTESSVNSTGTRAGVPTVVTANGFIYDLSDETAFTRGGISVPIYIARTDFTADRKNAIAEATLANLANYDVSIIALPTSRYNCHSYAWYQPSTSNTAFIGDITAYQSDVHSTVSSIPTPYSIAVYKDSANNVLHSAIVISVSGDTVICHSKWGADGLYEHELDAVPNAYKTSSGTTNCEFITVSVHSSPSVTQHNSTQHKGICTICGQTYYQPHNLYVTSYNASTHTRKCRNCGWTGTEAHTMNAATSKCMHCAYRGPSALVLIPVYQPNDSKDNFAVYN